MCARLLSCPLCSQPGFVTLDALRAGLVSVATRPLACPVCNETLLGIDKLTIHLFGHTINANIGKTDPHKITEAETNSIHGALILAQDWNASTAQTIVSQRSRVGETTNDKINFVQTSDSNPPQPFAKIVINKEPNSSTATNSQGCAPETENTNRKSRNEIIFVQNSTRRQIYSPTLTTLPMVFCSSTENERVSMVSAQDCQERHPGESSTINTTAIYQRGTFQENLKGDEDTPKQESVANFSENWIENLLHENSTKNCPCSTKESTREEKSYSISVDLSGLENLSKGDEKYSNYQIVSTSRNISTKVPTLSENPPNSNNSSVENSEEIFKKSQQSSPDSNDVLPQLKAFRLLAMKEKTERCDICGFHFPDRNILVLHKQLVHMIAEKDLNATPEELLKNYPCHLCSKVFRMRGSLMVHMRVAHIGYNLGLDAGSLSKDKDGELVCCENGFNCPTCGKNFRKEQHVTQHLKTHEGKQWECDVCSKMFTTKYFLKKHKRLHSGEMPYKCTICDKTFTFQQSYHKHRLYHKDDKPHTCATCGRCFKELSTLHNHERIHTGEKPFVCETCGKCFRQRVSYLVHRRIHTGVMPYKCDACGKSFRYKVSQRTHKCPAQPEDSVVFPIEGATGNNATKPGISLENQSIAEITPNEKNKFILIVDTQGHPILARESDSRTNNFLNDEQNAETPSDRKGNQGNERNLWNDNSSGEMILKNSTDSPGRECATREKLQSEDTADFFSLVMSPLENDLSSPSTEMEHLRLSSPGNEETRKQNDSHDNSETSSNNLQRDLNNAIEGIFNDNCSVNSPLQTINEESLKQLLYGIDRKV